MLIRNNSPKRTYLKGVFVGAVFLMSFFTFMPVHPVLAKGEGDKVLHYHFDKLEANKWEDASTYDNDGINHGANCSSWGKIGKCAYFEGENDDYIDCGSDPSLRLDTSDFTIALWVFLFNINGKNCFFHSAGAWNGEDDLQSVFFSTQKDTNGTPKLGFYGLKALASFQIPSETWTHIAVTFQRYSTYGYGYARFYKNGDPKNTVYMSDVPDFDYFSGANVGRTKWGGQYVDGGLDELRVYK